MTKTEETTTGTSAIYIERRGVATPEVVASGLSFGRAYDLAKKVIVKDQERSYIESDDGTMWVIKDRILNHMTRPYAVPGR